MPRDDYRAHAQARPIDGVLGLYPHPGHQEPVDLSRCPAQTPAARAILGRIVPPEEVETVLVQAHGGRARVALRAGTARLVRGDAIVSLDVDGDRLEASWPAWTPQSPDSLPALRRAVVDWLDPTPDDDVVEVGCGVGTRHREAERTDAARNAAHAGVSASFRVGRARKSLRRLIATGVRADLVLIHAMRRPLGPAVMSAVAAMRPRRVLYVAPSAASLARDLAVSSLMPTRIGFIDQLPGTAHLLTLAVLERER